MAALKAINTGASRRLARRIRIWVIMTSSSYHAELLPKGVATLGHHLYTITIADSGAPVGMLWFDLKHRHGKIKSFIFDFRLDEAFRGKGLTRA
jgi:hypothetical protein